MCLCEVWQTDRSLQLLPADFTAWTYLVKRMINTLKERPHCYKLEIAENDVLPTQLCFVFLLIWRMMSAVWRVLCLDRMTRLDLADESQDAVDGGTGWLRS